MGQDHFRKYHHQIDLCSDFADGRPLSGVRMEDGTFGCVLQKMELIKVEYVVGEGSFVNGMQYLKWKIVDCHKCPVQLDDICFAVLFLPLLDDSGNWEDSNGVYAVISEHWKELSLDGSFDWPLSTYPNKNSS